VEQRDADWTCTAQDDDVSQDDYDTRAECVTSNECIGCSEDGVCNETCPDDPDCDYVCGDTPWSCVAQDKDADTQDFETRAECEVAIECKEICDPSTDSNCVGDEDDHDVATIMVEVCWADDVCNILCEEDPDCDYTCRATLWSCIAQDDELSDSDLDTRAACEVAEVCKETCVEDNVCDETCPEDPDCDYACGATPGSCVAQDKNLLNNDIDTRAACEASELCNETCIEDDVCDVDCPEDPDCDYVCGDGDVCIAQDEDASTTDVDTRALCEALCTDCSLDGVCDPSCRNDPDCWGWGNWWSTTTWTSSSWSSTWSWNGWWGNGSGWWNSGGRGTAPELSAWDLAVVDDIIQKKIEIIEQQTPVVPESFGRELPVPLLLPATWAQL